MYTNSAKVEMTTDMQEMFYKLISSVFKVDSYDDGPLPVGDFIEF